MNNNLSPYFIGFNNNNLLKKYSELDNLSSIYIKSNTKLDLFYYLKNENLLILFINELKNNIDKLINVEFQVMTKIYGFCNQLNSNIINIGKINYILRKIILKKSKKFCITSDNTIKANINDEHEKFILEIILQLYNLEISFIGNDKCLIINYLVENYKNITNDKLTEYAIPLRFKIPLLSIANHNYLGFDFSPIKMSRNFLVVLNLDILVSIYQTLIYNIGKKFEDHKIKLNFNSSNSQMDNFLLCTKKFENLSMCDKEKLRIELNILNNYNIFEKRLTNNQNCQIFSNLSNELDSRMRKINQILNEYNCDYSKFINIFREETISFIWMKNIIDDCKNMLLGKKKIFQWMFKLDKQIEDCVRSKIIYFLIWNNIYDANLLKNILKQDELEMELKFIIKKIDHDIIPNIKLVLEKKINEMKREF